MLSVNGGKINKEVFLKRIQEGFMNEQELIKWLLEGDVAIQYQVHRDLFGEELTDLRQRIATEGYGQTYLSHRNSDGHWGRGFYQPKWICSHYTLLDLRNLGLPRDNPQARETVEMIAKQEKGIDGGVNPAETVSQSDVCINGMFMNYACYFSIDPELLESAVDFILSQKMDDGGFNCRLNRSGAKHSSLHTTICVLEGICSYKKYGYSYRLKELEEAEKSAAEFILMHQFYRSDRTGDIISKRFLNFPFPPRWHYDIVRALDCFRERNAPFDKRMELALEELKKKRKKDGRWTTQSKIPGETHLIMEKPGTSRWNTLRVMRILNKYI